VEALFDWEVLRASEGRELVEGAQADARRCGRVGGPLKLFCQNEHCICHPIRGQKVLLGRVLNGGITTSPSHGEERQPVSYQLHCPSIFAYWKCQEVDSRAPAESRSRSDKTTESATGWLSVSIRSAWRKHAFGGAPILPRRTCNASHGAHGAHGL
jgi:hypothetical protein